MSTIPFVPLGPPPLPPGWTEHISPTGQTYYHNSQTQESTYVRPLPVFPVLTSPGIFPTAKTKKEKPLVKTPIPGTDWLRVKTTEGNTFYSNKSKKESVWTVPPEIKDVVEALEQDEQEKEEQARSRAYAEEQEKEEEAERERLVEIERIKSEVQAMAKRKADDASFQAAASPKRAKIEQEGEEGDREGEESDEEEWQREAATQLAAEKEKREHTERESTHEAEAEARVAKEPLNMPAKVDLSLEEAKALFKTLLREKDINPLHPWDTCLPLFVSDPRYVLLPSVSARRDAFDEYCRDRARELRREVVKSDLAAANPKEDFERLLREEVKSTRTSWTDFRRTWKKDRRFWGWGSDDREREKRFREFVRELGEKKRQAAQQAEVEFFALLRECQLTDSPWKEVKGSISRDPRYDAVGSSSLREELYNTFLKAGASVNALQPNTIANKSECGDDPISPVADQAAHEQQLKEKRERAVKEREMKVRAEKGRVDIDIGRSRMGLNKGEGEQQFNSMLTDAIRDPQVTWESVLPQLRNDPRFTHSPLSLNQQLHLFHIHIGQLRSKQVDGLHNLFQSHAPSLATPFTALPLPSLLSSLPVTKLRLDARSLEQNFDIWQRKRLQDARKSFDEMLTENSFVEFWGRLGKIGGKGIDDSIGTDDIEESEGEKVDMKTLAKHVDVQEIEKVLKNDRRYINFDHVPEQRDRWIREYLSQLSAPKLSVHLQTN